MNTLERKLPIGIQTFEDIRQGNYLYVDKTSILWQIINTGKPYFLSRPRRFGKSLLISTLEAYFQGRKDLFEGLAIEKLETKWEQYPVPPYRQETAGTIPRGIDLLLGMSGRRSSPGHHAQRHGGG